MTITTLPTRDAADLGAALSNVRAPVANELSAVHVENVKDWIIDLATEVGKTDGSTAGSLRKAINDLGGGAGGLLLDMPIATASLASTASWGRTDANTPAAPAGTQLVDLVADPVLASRNCLRAGVTGGAGEGLWLYKVQNVTLPDEGFVLEVDIADLPDVSVSAARAVIGIAYDDYALGGARSTPRGLFVTLERGSANVYLSAWALASTVYTAEDPAVTDFDSITLHDQTAIDRGGVVLRIEVRRKASVTPAQWLVRCTLKETTGGVPHSSVSGVSSPVTDLDGRALASIGLGGHVDTSAGPAGNAWISVRALRVYRL